MAFHNPYSDKLKEFSAFAFDGEPKRVLWPDFFKNRTNRAARRRILEIGCSNARFLSKLAQAHPDTDFIGVDWKYKVLYKGANSVAQDGIQNLALIRGRAQHLNEWMSAGELDEIWIFFPDPWPKTAQIKNRLIQEDFLKQAHSLLKPGGKIYFKTDHPGYFQWVLALFGVEAPELPDYEKLLGCLKEGAKNRRARQFYYRKVEGVNLPKSNIVVKRLFDLEKFSTDLWKNGNQSGLFELSIAPLFVESQTLFEKAFLRDRLPIYFIELTSI